MFAFQAQGTSLHPDTFKQVCAEKAASVVYANASIEPYLRGTNTNIFDYKLVSTEVGEDELAYAEEYTFSVTEISWAVVTMLKNDCRLMNFELGIGE